MSATATSALQQIERIVASMNFVGDAGGLAAYVVDGLRPRVAVQQALPMNGGVEHVDALVERGLVRGGREILDGQLDDGEVAGLGGEPRVDGRRRLPCVDDRLATQDRAGDHRALAHRQQGDDGHHARA